MEKDVIQKSRFSRGQFISNYFLVPKPDGSKRFILNLKPLNKWISNPHFKMEDIRTATKLLGPDIYMCHIDLKDAYFLLNVRKSSRKYLRFIFQEELYQFKCLPFGLCTSPYVFTKIMKPVIQYLRNTGLLSTIYLDDILLFGETVESCLDNVQKTTNLLKKLGFEINYEKSSLTPSKECKFLGFIINSNRFSLELTQEKRKTLIRLSQQFLNKSQCTIRSFAHLMGSLVAACPAVAYGWLYTKLAEREKHLALIRSRGNYDNIMTISGKVKSDISWWLNNLVDSYNPVRKSDYRLEIFSDASLTGWGAVCNGQKAHGFWNPLEQKLHINNLELIAAFFALKTFASKVKNCEILLRIDNTTAISYINRMGGIKYYELNKTAREIWQWAENRRIWLFASYEYIPSGDNIDADKESRRLSINTEWELNNSVFKTIVKTLVIQ